MKTALARYAAPLTFALLAACGGDSGPSAKDAVRMLLDQSAECWTVAAGRKSSDHFNAVASVIASVPQSAVCSAWPIFNVPCADVYAAYSKPFDGMCVL